VVSLVSMFLLYLNCFFYLSGNFFIGSGGARARQRSHLHRNVGFNDLPVADFAHRDGRYRWIQREIVTFYEVGSYNL
jgi:hypothetical protein